MNTAWKRFFALLVVGIMVGTLAGCNILGSDDETFVPAPAPIYVLSHMTAKAGMTAVAITALNDFIAKTRTESGCLRYDAFQGTTYTVGGADASREFCLLEVWKDQDAITFHLGTAWFGQFFGSAAATYDLQAGTNSIFDVTSMISTLGDKAATPILSYSFGKLVSVAGQEANVQTALVNFMTSTRLETGCVKFDLFQGMPTNGTSSGTFQVFEVYAGDDALATHTAAAYTTTFVNTATPLSQSLTRFGLKRLSLPAANIINPTPATQAQQKVIVPAANLAFYSKAMNEQK